MNGPFYEPGYYACTVTQQAWGKSKNDHPQLIFKHKPEYLVNAFIGDDGEVQQTRKRTAQQYERTIYLTFPAHSEQAMDFALMKLRHAGFEGDDLRELNFAGQEILVECKHAPSNKEPGQLFESWELPLPPRESEPMDSDDSVARKLNTLFGRKLKAGAKSEPSANVAEATNNPSEPGSLDSDIPF